MYALGLVGDRDLTGLRDRLLDTLDAHGPTALIEAGADVDSADSAGRTRYRIDDTGGWRATGRGLDAEAALERLAPAHEYALVTGRPDPTLPSVVVGGPDDEERALVTAAEPSEVDPAAVHEALLDTEPIETLGSLIAAAKRAPAADRAGAVATFTGRVRARDDPDDTPTTHLEFEKYEGVAEERLATIRTELEARDGVFAVRMHHRTGVIETGEDIVFVVVLAGHRAEAFETVSDGIDRLKDEVPIFKKEVTVEDTFWKHERQ